MTLITYHAVYIHNYVIVSSTHTQSLIKEHTEVKDSGEPLLVLQSGEGENPLLMQLKTLNSNLKDIEVIYLY